MKNPIDATYVVFHNNKCMFLKKEKREWFINFSDGLGWEGLKKWKFVKVFWFFGLKVDICGMTHKLVKVGKNDNPN